MRFSTWHIVGAFALFVASGVCAGATGKVPSATELLFDLPHLAHVDAGSKVSYRLEQKISDQVLLGQPIMDDISISVGSVAQDGKRDVKVAVFTGERARPVQEIAGISNNPVMVVFLDRAVRNYAVVAGGRTSYLKNRFRVELSSHAKVEPTKVSYNGGEFDGYRVTLTPFVRDPNRYKMRGYEGSTYSFTVSDAVPGYIVELQSVIESPKEGAPRFEERIRFVGVGSAN